MIGEALNWCYYLDWEGICFCNCTSAQVVNARKIALSRLMGKFGCLLRILHFFFFFARIVNHPVLVLFLFSGCNTCPCTIGNKKKIQCNYEFLVNEDVDFYILTAYYSRSSCITQQITLLYTSTLISSLFKTKRKYLIKIEIV